MPNKIRMTEKTKPKVYKAKEGVFAVVTSDENKIGQINTISKGGLSFQYISNGKFLSGCVEIEIFSTAGSFYLNKLSAEVVMDFQVDNAESLSSVPMGELVVRFGKMKPGQISMLDYFIQKYTTRL